VEMKLRRPGIRFDVSRGEALVAFSEGRFRDHMGLNGRIDGVLFLRY
jgi:hypothetical protein